MYCPKCGSPNEKTAKFCIKCGARLPAPGQPEAKLATPPPPPVVQQRQGPVTHPPPVPSKAKRRSKLVYVMLALIVLLVLVLAVEVVILLTGWPDQVLLPGEPIGRSSLPTQAAVAMQRALAKDDVSRLDSPVVIWTEAKILKRNFGRHDWDLVVSL